MSGMDGASGRFSSGLRRGDSSQFSKPLLRELAALRLIGVLSPMEIWRKPHLSPACTTYRPAAWASHTNPDLYLRCVPDLRLKCDLMSRYFTFSANISRKLIVRIPPEIQMARNPRCMERFPPIPAPIAKKKIIPK